MKDCSTGQITSFGFPSLSSIVKRTPGQLWPRSSSDPNQTHRWDYLSVFCGLHYVAWFFLLYCDYGLINIVFIGEENNLVWKVLFDSDCPVCCKFSKLIQNMDKNSNFILESYQYYSDHNAMPPKEELSKEIHIINNNGEIKRGAEAVTTILAVLPGLRPYRWMVESRWGKRGTKILYKKLERHRKCRNCR